MIEYHPEQIFVEKSVRSCAVTQNVLARLPDAGVHWIDCCDSLLEDARIHGAAIPRAKKQLILARHKGRFFKACPAGTARQGAANVCCNYFVINFASNCHMECSYCYLQSYLNFPYMIVYANSGDLFRELDEILDSSPERKFRIGTGELADSLALDPLTSYSVPLVNYFAGKQNALLEFKTKSDCVENLIGLDHRGKTIPSWSINPPFVQETEEHKTASISRRLEAADRCVRSGYRVAFHLDPVVDYPGWKEDYPKLLDEIFCRFPGRSLAWMSVGALRMTPQLKEVIKQRFPGSRLPYGEMLPAADGKLRYFKPLRVQLLSSIISRIRELRPQLPIYTCMESSDVWCSLFGSNPPEEREIGAQLIENLL